MEPLYEMLYPQLGIVRGPTTPEGVYARVVDGRTLYVNTQNAVKEVAIDGRRSGVLSGQAIEGVLLLPPWGVELVE
jgi:beta-galactosidase